MALPFKKMDWTGRTLCDAIDGTNAPQGGMQTTANLVPDPSTNGCWVPRPAAVRKFSFDAFLNPRFTSAELVVGDIVYGMLATSRFPGKDEPYAYDLANGVFLPISGVLSSNVPTSPSATGDWTPPILCQVGSRIIMTHPGFPGGATKFGWLDISGFSLSTVGSFQPSLQITGDTDTAFQQTINGMPAMIGPGGELVIQYRDALLPVPLGSAITGTNIAANTTIVSAKAVYLFNYAGNTHSNTTIDNLTDKNTGLNSTAGLYVGQQISGGGIPTGTTITAINRGAFSMTISQNATLTFTAGLNITGTQLNLSQNVTGTGDGITFTIPNSTLVGGNPTIIGVQPGMLIAGTNIPAGTSVVSTANISANLVAVAVAGSTNLTIEGNVNGPLSTGMAVSGNGVPTGTTLASFTSTTLVLSQPMLISGSEQLFLTGSSITVSQALTAVSPVSNVALTITGGTRTNPLWGAGDTNLNNLPSTPLSVAQMNGRAYYACGLDGIPFSDPLEPCQLSNATAVQALLPSNGIPVTALGSLQLSSLVGGIVQGLIAFQRDAQMQQITGDAALGTLQMNSLPVATGTHAPLSICGGPFGLFFVSPLGLRLIDFGGRVSEPIGMAGQGVAVPFILANNPPLPGPVAPSRICAAVNGNVVRITTPTASGVAYEFWYDINRKVWSGPHTSAASLIQTWSDTFLMSPVGINGALWKSDDIPGPSSTYVENGALLSCAWGTVLLPDNREGSMNAMVEATLACSVGQTISVSAADSLGNVLDTVTIEGTPAAPGWGGFNWGALLWGSSGPAFQQRRLNWTHPILFKQLRIVASAVSDPSVRIGNLYMKHEPLGYQLGKVA